MRPKQLADPEQAATLQEACDRWHRLADDLLHINLKLRRLEQEWHDAVSLRDSLRAQESAALQVLEANLAEFAPEEKQKYIHAQSFSPGNVGVKLLWPFVVAVAPDSQAHSAGIGVGWRICRVNAEEATEELVQQLLAGTQPFALTFQQKTMKQDDRQQQYLSSGTRLPPWRSQRPPQPLPKPWLQGSAESAPTPREFPLSPAARLQGIDAQRSSTVEQDYEDWERGLAWTASASGKDEAGAVWPTDPTPDLRAEHPSS
mmetsp:Transcript_17621/g.40943  ORF Transcript_17621/g.40943 Transcript_17621/m.40943 type:complete len:259 (+) Transcript_17621:41-817(+)